MGAFAFESNASFEIPSEIFRGQVDQDNNPIYEEIDRDIYVVPPTDTYHLKLTGFTKPYTDAIPAEYQKEGGPTTRQATNLELEIVSGRGAGRRFFWNFITMSLGMGKNPSHLGRIYMAGKLNGEKPPQGTQLYFDDVIGAEFQAYVIASDIRDNEGRPKYAKLAKETIKPVPAEGAEYNPFDDNKVA